LIFILPKVESRQRCEISYWNPIYSIKCGAAQYQWLAFWEKGPYIHQYFWFLYYCFLWFNV